MRKRPRFGIAMAVALAAVLSTARCGNGASTGPIPTPLLGTWIVTSLIVNGEDLAAQGMHLSFHFSAEGEYSYLVQNDLFDMCDGASSCSDWGEFNASATHITFDPGPGSERCSYSINGTVMTMSGSWSGKTYTATLAHH
jgi:hypothetical protein